MDKILNKSKSMLFGRKNGKKDDNLRDSESFYDVEENSWSPKMHTQTLGLKTKKTMSLEPSSHPGPGGGYLNGSPNYYTFRRDTQPTVLPRYKPTSLDRSSSTIGANPPTLSLNADGGERYRLEMNSAGRLHPTFPFQAPSRDPVGTFDKNHQSKNGTANPRSNALGTGNLNMAGVSQLSDTSFQGCSISAPITSELFAVETKFDPSTNRNNVKTLRSTSAGEGLGRHIPISSNPCSLTSLDQMQISNKNNEPKHIARSPQGPSSPLRGRRSLNFFNTAAQTSNPVTRSTNPLSASTEKYNVSNNLKTVDEKEMSSKSREAQPNHLLPNLIRYGTQNRVSNSSGKKESESEGIKSKTISSPILDDNNSGPRPFHSRTTSDNHLSFNSVQPLSLRSHPKFHPKKPDGHSEHLEEENRKEKSGTVSPNIYGSSSSMLQTSSSLPTPPTSSTTLSFIANQLDIPELDIDKRLEGQLNFKTEANTNVTSQIPPSRSEELDAALQIQNQKLDELCERVGTLSELLDEEMTSKRLFVKRISHLENEVRGLRWILSERERTKRADWGSELVDYDSRGSHSQVTSTEGSSSSRYDGSVISGTTEKDKEGKVGSGAITRSHYKHFEPGPTMKTPPPATRKMDDNRRKRFGLALDLSPSPSPDSTPTTTAPFRSSTDIPSRRWGGKV